MPGRREAGEGFQNDDPPRLSDPCRGGGPARCAFTLAELVIVVLIVGILAAVAAPRYAASLNRYRLEATALRVASDLEVARREARRLGKSQSVVFTPAAGSYDLPGMTHPDHPSRPYTIDLADTGFPASIQSVAFGSSGTGDTIVFDRYGRPDFPGSAVIGLGGATRTVQVDEAGRVRVTP